MKTKGVAIRSILLSIEKIWQPAGLLQITQALPEELRAHLQPMVLAGSWYPVALPAALHDAVRTVYGNGTWKHSYAIGVAAGKIDFGGVYRFVLRALPYETLFSRMSRTWHQYQSQGEVTWTTTSVGFASGTVTGVVGLNEGIWLSVAGRLAALLELSGGRNVKWALHEPMSTSCKFELTWQPG